MNENIDLTKILEGCPEGTKLYSTTLGEVFFVGICLSSNYPIIVKAYNKHSAVTASESFTMDGRYSRFYDGECTLFPSKDQRDWSRFERFWDKKLLDKPVVEKFDINTLHPFDRVLVRDFLNEGWMADFFERIDENDVHYNVICVTSHWIQCIPYNDDTKHLLGTNKEAPEFYKYWED